MKAFIEPAPQNMRFFIWVETLCTEIDGLRGGWPLTRVTIGLRFGRDLGCGVGGRAGRMDWVFWRASKSSLMEWVG
jgi:hypothetical protein